MTWVAEPAPSSVSTLEDALLVQRTPGHVEQIGYAKVIETLKGERAGVHEGGRAHDGGQQVRNDAERTRERPRFPLLFGNRPAPPPAPAWGTMTQTQQGR